VTPARIAAAFAISWLIAFTPMVVHADELEFRPPPSASDRSAPAVMRDLAIRLIPVYQDPDPDRYLANVSALQMAALNYTAANASRKTLRERRRRADVGKPVARSILFDLFARAKAMEAERQIPFAEGFTQAYRETIPKLGNHDAFAVSESIKISPAVFREAMDRAFDQQRARDSIELSAAVDLIWEYLAFEAYRSIAPFAATLDAEDNRQRYSTDRAVTIKTPTGVILSAIVVRPVAPAKPLPALLEFAIDTARNNAKEYAAHGFVGVAAYARGKMNSHAEVVAYQHDGEDARAVIDWIAHQPWSDGQVGMLGDGYSGFTPWAAAKTMPEHLKAIATSASTAPGIDLPMAGNIFQNSAYRWSLYVTNTDPSEQEAFYDDERWRALDQKWYREGARLRDLGRLNDKPNPIFVRWLNHPSYDRYWQTMIPYREEFARIKIPVLTTTGYYAGSQRGALYYFTQHTLYNPNADHTLIVGPYDDSVMQRGPMATLQSYAVDASALLDLRELRLQWLSYVLKGGPKPSLLKDRVNFEVMGANEWRSAPTLAAMATGSMRFYFDPTAVGDGHRLSQRKIPKHTFVRLTVDLKDRSDAAWTVPTEFISKSLAARNSVMFISDPFSKPFQLNGMFSGQLDFTVNKMDMDLNISLYELLPSGDYIHLFNPTYEFRASYEQDRAHRKLLRSGERQQLKFVSEQLTSRQFQPGSRLVMVLGLSKRPDREINYGTGNDVSDELIDDATAPINVRWYGGSYIDIPTTP